MSLSLLAPLQIAVYEVLADDPAYSLYDTPPDGAPLPHISFGSADVTVRRASGGLRLYEVGMSLHVWSGADSQMEVKTLMDQVAGKLVAAPLTIEGAIFVGTEFIAASTRRRFHDTGPLHEGQVNFRIRLSKGDINA